MLSNLGSLFSSVELLGKARSTRRGRPSGCRGVSVGRAGASGRADRLGRRASPASAPKRGSSFLVDHAIVADMVDLSLIMSVAAT
jgi:hypothetical protein